LNYAGKFGTGGLGPDSGVDIDLGLLSQHGHLSSSGKSHVDKVSTHAPSDAIIISDAHLLFHGDFKRSGVDLVLSSGDHEVVLHEYFKGEKRAALASPDGAHLTGDIVNALSGHTQFAQADGSASVAPAVIGHVTKLTGNATAIRNGVSIVLNQGDTVHKGDVVQSGSDSTLGITFIDGTVFGLASNAKMVLNEMIYDPSGSDNKSLLSLVQGTISFVAGATAKKGDMKVDTPVATMGIRGTAVLVEIDFEVPSQGGAPPARFQVLVEPDGTTGSYILFDKTTLTPIATVNQAGTQTIINGQGAVSFVSSAQLSPDAQKIITDVFSLKFSDLNNPNTKLTNNTNGSIDPQTVFLKLASNDFVPVTLQFVNVPDKLAPSPGTGPTPRLEHIPGPPDADASDGSFTERADITGSAVADSVSGIVSYVDVNPGDVPSVKAAFSSFAYANAQNVDVTTTLTAEQLAAIEAVEVPLVVVQDPNGKNIGQATWTYTIADGAFDFLAVGETLTLTYMARVDNNYAPSNETTFVPFTIAITGTNDKPTLSATGGTITERIGTGNTAIDTVTGSVTFADTDLTDRPVVSAAISTTDPFRYYNAGGNDVTATLTPAQRAAILAVEVPLTVVQSAGNTHNGSASWTYSIADSKFDFMAKGETLTLNYVAQVDDGHGGVVSTPITVSIQGGADVVVIGTNDVPTIEADSTTATDSVMEDEAATLVAGGTITFQDLDLTDTHTASFVLKSSNANANLPGYSETAPLGQIGAFSLTTVSENPGVTNVGSIGWSFALNNSDPVLQSLAVGQTITQVYTVTFNDHHGGTVTQDVTVTITGTNDAPTIVAGTTTASGGVTEDAGTPTLTSGGTIVIQDLDLIDTHTATWEFKASASNVHLPGFNEGSTHIGTFTIDPSVTESASDTNNVATLGWSFALSNNDAVLQSLAVGQTITQVYTVTFIDNNSASIAQDVTVTITGINDAPTIVPGSTVSGSVTEDVGVVSDEIGTLGTISFQDLDLIDTHTASFVLKSSNANADLPGYSEVAPLSEIGTFALTTVSEYPADTTNTASLGWTFTLDNDNPTLQSLALNQTITQIYTVTVSDGHGGTVLQDVAVTITGTNDAPVLAASTPYLTTITEDQTANAGQTVASFLGSSIADVDHGALQGIAITATTSAHGHWEYSINGGTFVTFPAVSGGSALLLAATDMVRFVPDGKDGGTDTFTYVAWDQTTGSHGAVANVSASGGSAAFSVTSNTATLTVTAVNDAPTATAPPTHYAATEQTPLTISGTGLHVADVDANGGTETVTLSVGQGILNVNKGSNPVSIAGNGTSSVTITGLLDYIEALLSGSNLGTISYTANSDNPSASTGLTLSVNDNGHTGAGGSQTATATATIDIAPINDAPVTTDDVASITGNTGSISGHLLANDTDAEHDTLFVSNVVNGVAASGHITVDGTYGRVVIDQVTGDYTYTLGATSAQAAAVAALGHDVTVQDDFTYTASDGTLGGEGHLKVSVTGVGEAPVLSAGSIRVEENGGAVPTTTVFDIKLSDDDPASDMTVTASALHGTLSSVDAGNISEINAQFANGIIYTPTNYNGDTHLNDIVTVTATDANGQSDTLNFVFQQSGWNGAALVGTDEKDVIFATEGNDTLTGGAGADQFVFAPESECDPSADEITDFKQGEDHIDLRAFAQFVNAENITGWLADPDHVTTTIGGDKLITLGTGDTITLKGLAAASLLASDFIVSPH
jgi:VCBS repeat-containing protein